MVVFSGEESNSYPPSAPLAWAWKISMIVKEELTGCEKRRDSRKILVKRYFQNQEFIHAFFIVYM